MELPQTVPGNAGPAVKKPSRLGVLHFIELQIPFLKKKIN